MPKIDTLFLADSFEAFVTKLDAFADAFERLATTPEQHTVAAEFSAFVGAMSQELVTCAVDMQQLSAKALLKAEHGHETLASLRQEILADEAAAKQTDAHWYANEAIQTSRDGKSETPVERANDQKLER